MTSSRATTSAKGFVLGFNDGALAMLATAILLLSSAIWVAHAPNAEKTDFALTYVGAKIVHGGMGSRLYDIGLQTHLRDSLFRNPSPLYFEHPPFEALLLSPLAALPFRSAYMAWSLLNATLWTGLMFFLRAVLPWPREDLAYILLWLLFAPLWVALYQGQSSLILLVLYALSFGFLKSGKEFSAGLTLAFGLFKFQFVLPFALIFLLRRRLRFLYGFAATFILLFGLSILTVHWDGLKRYLSFILAIGSNPQNLSYGSAVDMPTIYGVMYAIMGPVLSHTRLNVAVGVLSLILLGFVAQRWEMHKRPGQMELMFSAAIAASLAAGSHMFTHDFSPLALPMFFMAAQFSTSSFPTVAARAIRVAMCIALVLFWSFPIYFMFVAWHCLYLMCPVLLIFCLAAVRAADFVNLNKQDDLQFVIAH
jgi:hypothetical protein